MFTIMQHLNGKIWTHFLLVIPMFQDKVISVTTYLRSLRAWKYWRQSHNVAMWVPRPMYARNNCSSCLQPSAMSFNVWPLTTPRHWDKHYSCYSVVPWLNLYCLKCTVITLSYSRPVYDIGSFSDFSEWKIISSLLLFKNLNLSYNSPMSWTYYTDFLICDKKLNLVIFFRNTLRL